jgi:hypothetical protein
VFAQGVGAHGLARRRGVVCGQREEQAHGRRALGRLMSLAGASVRSFKVI